MARDFSARYGGITLAADPLGSHSSFRSIPRSVMPVVDGWVGVFFVVGAIVGKPTRSRLSYQVSKVSWQGDVA